MKNVTYILFLILLVQSCGTGEEKISSAAVDDSASDWPGIYSGVIPCADCEGIETTLQINPNMTYVLSETYLGKSDQPPQRNGAFTWNKALDKIKLAGIESGPSEYLVDTNGVWQLDINGKKITGDLAVKYLLIKTPENMLGFYRWKLTQLMGKYLDSKSSASLRLEMEDRRFHGFGWCNAFNGLFELQDGGRLSFGSFSPTPRTCPDTTAETQFLNVLRIVDSYKLKGRELTLSRGDLPPMATFVGTMAR